MTKTKIEWTDATWNPIRGCSRVSAGCKNCYAERIAARFSGVGMPYEGLSKNGRWTGEVRFVTERIDDPRQWKKPRRIFVNSMSDLFHKKVKLDWIGQIYTVMRYSPQHTFQILTKRPQGMLEYFKLLPASMILPNVWLGVSVEDQKTADERIPLLLQTPAAVRFISAEPLLGPINLVKAFGQGVGELMTDHLDWVIVGGESGPGARPMNPDWARSLRDQCEMSGVKFFMKQMSKKEPIPEDLLIREFP